MPGFSRDPVRNPVVKPLKACPDCVSRRVVFLFVLLPVGREAQKAGEVVQMSLFRGKMLRHLQNFPQFSSNLPARITVIDGFSFFERRRNVAQFFQLLL